MFTSGTSADRPANVLPPLVIGEVLFDQFGDGRSVLGGAPFNVAWNLQGFGYRPQFVSAIGDDEVGKQVLDRMHGWEMDTDGVQTREDQPTGTVQVTVRGGQPSYEIVYPRAYDFIEPPLLEGSGPFSLLYHGTLALRGERSRETIKQLAQTSTIPRFVDVNIREPWFDTAWLTELIPGSKYVKLNDEELGKISEMPVSDSSQVEAAVKAFRHQYGGEIYFITCGSQGAYAVTDQTITFAPAPKPEVMVDTVGAGDGFAAAAIHGVLQGLSYQEILDRAVTFAARVCGMQGATTIDKSIYQNW
ncbi:2-dehydro-3-deoxygluconokinase [Novipirellula aureliae]|uniref:2-dehydro-3-deoxygluconokinase n=1 Tax=Novipirellula aureliae TaxID=2527966 RepID=A0A5C6DUW5_9BACT|nr:PfkB family carbohydrate kinase [Novipirellula aureliae]TWU41163.1 2-dehydro-3-deoxygluconokinase [Novipirellula aureliae]